MAACAVPVVLGFVLPAGVLLWHTVRRSEGVLTSQFIGAAVNSIRLAAIVAVFAVAIALVLAYARRFRRLPLLRYATALAGLGYAIPGTVLALGLLIPLAGLDNRIDAGMRSMFGVSADSMVVVICRAANGKKLHWQGLI